MARKQKKADNAAVTLLKSLLAGLVEAAEDGDEEAVAIIEDAGLSLDGASDADADEDEGDEDEGDEDDYSEMSLKELRALAKERGIKLPRGAKEDDIIELLEEADEDGEDEDEDEDEGDEDDYSEMSLKELRALAKERGIKVPRGAKEDDIIDLLEEADEEGEEEDEDEDEDEDGDVDYSEMSLKELKAECKEQGIKVPRGAKADDLIELLEDAGDEEEDEGDEDEDEDDIPDLDEMDDKELIALAKKLGLKGRANADKAYDFLADHYGLEDEDEDEDDGEEEDDWDDED